MMGRRAFAVALWLGTATAGCGSDETSLLVRLLVEDDGYRPQYALINVLAPGANPTTPERIPPGEGLFDVTARELATIVVSLDGGKPGERRVVVRGMRNGEVLSMAVQRVPWRAGAQQDVALTFGPKLPDADADGVPDPIDD